MSVLTYVRQDFAVQFVHEGNYVTVSEFSSDEARWRKVDVYLCRAKTPNGLMRSASRWISANRWEQLELPINGDARQHQDRPQDRQDRLGRGPVAGGTG